MPAPILDRNAVRDNVRHLRLPFQMTLAPIFLWGWVVSGTSPAWRLVPAFLAFHVFLYTGITAFNSYYDRDEGPIGGLQTPPAVRGSLLPLSLSLQAVGLLLAVPVGMTFCVIYGVFVVLGVLYSHPSTRWKANPLLSTLVVCLGQGALGFLAGWVAAKGGAGSAVGLRGALGAAAAALTTLGMYPLTQVYQVAEDERRGDHTLCVVLGPKGGLRIAQWAFAAAGATSSVMGLSFFRQTDALILAGAYGVLIWLVERFRREYASLSTSEAFRTVHLLSYGASAAFTLFIAAHLAGW